MDTQQIAALARTLFAAQGPKAIADAAKKADQFAESGDAEQAKMWRRVESELREIRGPRQT